MGARRERRGATTSSHVTLATSARFANAIHLLPSLNDRLPAPPRPPALGLPAGAPQTNPLSQSCLISAQKCLIPVSFSLTPPP